MRYFGDVAKFGWGNRVGFESSFESSTNNAAYIAVGADTSYKMAMKYALDSRIDRLILLSPNITQKQIIKNKTLETCIFLDSAESLESLKSMESLESKEFMESSEILMSLMERGVIIEAYFGTCDNEIDLKTHTKIFSTYGIVYLLKGRNHFLKPCSLNNGD